MEHQLKRFSRLLGDFRPGEFRRVSFLMAQFGLVVFALLLARTVRDAMFLSRSGLKSLPWMYVGVALVQTAATIAYTRAIGKRDPRRAAPWVQAVFAASFVAFAFAAGIAGEGIYMALYLWTEVLTALTTMQFWNITGSEFHPRQAKRLYGFIAAGQAFGNLACGVVASAAGVWITVEQLLLVVATVSLIAGLMYLGRRPAAASDKGLAPVSTALQRERATAARHYAVLVAAAVAGTYLATSWVDFQFKVIARRSFDEAELTRFFGQFYAAVGIAAFVIQFVLLRHVTRWFGLFGALAMMPLCFLGMGALLPLYPLLTVATALKFSENGLRYAIHEPLMQTLYLPLPPQVRTRAQSFASGVVKPVAMGAAGLLLVIVRPDLPGGVSAESLGLGIAASAGVVVLLLLRLRGGYVRVLLSDTARAARERRPHTPVPVTEAADVARVEALMGNGGPAAVAWGLDRLRLTDAEAAVDLLTMALDRDDLPLELRARVLGEALSDARVATRVVERLRDPVLQTIAAVRARPGDWRRLLALCDGSPADVQQAVLLQLLASAQAEAVLQARDHLRLMLISPRPTEHAVAVKLAEFLPEDERRATLATALAASSVDLRAAALGQLAQRPEPTLIPQVLVHADHPLLRPRAVSALAAAGREGLAAASQRFGNAPWRHLGALWPAYARAARGLDWPEVARDVVAREPDVVFWPPAIAAAARAGNGARGDAETQFHAALGHADRLAVARDRLLSGREGPAAALLRIAVRDRLQAALQAALASLFRIEKPALERWERLLGVDLVDGVRARHNVAEIVDEAVTVAARRDLIARLEGQLPFVEVGPEIFRDMIAPLPALAGIAFASVEEAHVDDAIRRVLFLSSVPLFKNVAGEDLEPVAEAMREERHGPGAMFIRRGDAGDALYLITDGTVRVHVGEQSIAELGAGAVVGEMALLDDQPRSADVSAVTPATTLRLDRADFEQLLDTHPLIGRAIMRVLTERLRKAIGK